jgi:hypothetical protein
MSCGLRLFCRSVIGLVITTAAFIVLYGCAANSTPSPAPEATIQTNLALIQQNGNLSARLYGIMDFDYSGSVVRSPTELAVSGVPLQWMGANFNGKLQKSSTTEDVIDEVHGSFSDDGNWVESIYYSRQILRKGTNSSGTFYRINLKNIPINEGGSGTAANPGIFERSGTDIQKFINRIEYIDGLMKDGQIEPTIKYISTDWTNSSPGQTPSINLVFAKGSGNAGGTAKSGM